jgi:N-acetylglucosaminylphosphatidylinositol deacetylase
MFEVLFEHGKLVLFGLNLIVFVAILWSTRSPPQAKDEEGQGDVLLVTAHPDDEVMFFSPLLVSLQRQRRKVHILCLSGSSNAREKEFAMSCGRLGVSTWSVGKFADGFDQIWDPSLVAEAVAKQAIKIRKIKTIVTFDERGVSGHPNHVACWRGCVKWATDQPSLATVVLCLDSVSVVRKYLGLIEAVFTVVLGATPFFLSFDPLLVWRLMSANYKSQFVWYRQLYVLFSRYVYINTFQVHTKRYYNKRSEL